MKEKVRTRIDFLRPLLKDPVPSVRVAAAEAIEILEAASSFEDIIATLKTGNMGARIGAIYALGEIGGTAVLQPLAYCAKRAETDIRSAAAAALGKVAQSAALPIIVELLDDESPTVQGRAIASLRNYSVTVDIINRLHRFLDASDGVLEAEAALTLAHLKDEYSLNQIVTLLGSTHASTREAAATALSLIPIQ